MSSQLPLPLPRPKTAMEQDRAWRAEWRAMTEAQQDRAVEDLIAKFNEVKHGTD